MKRVFLYARVSTQKQAERDLSIPDQLAAMRTHAAARKWEVAGEYVDEGVSGTTDRRPEFQRMIDDACCAPPPAQIILVHSFTRLFRESFLQELYRRKLEENGIVFASVTEEFGEGDAGLLMQKLSSFFSEWQSREIPKHVTRTPWRMRVRETSMGECRRSAIARLLLGNRETGSGKG